jgi:hypothetical protein
LKQIKQPSFQQVHGQRWKGGGMIKKQVAKRHRQHRQQQMYKAPVNKYKGRRNLSNVAYHNKTTNCLESMADDTNGLTVIHQK